MQLAVYCGWLLNGPLGGLLAGGFFIFPAFILLSGLGWLYQAYGALPLVQGFFVGIRPVVVALVILSTIRLSRKNLKTPLLTGIALFSFLGLSVVGMSYPAVLIATVLLGALVGSRWRHLLIPRHPGAPEAHASSPSPALSLTSFCGTLLVGIASWLTPILLSRSWLGPSNILEQLGVFFTQSALLVFGGAYSLIPYVSDAMVNVHGWLTPGEIIDSLALGETTPGPLLMVFTFMGYLTGSKSPDLMPLSSPWPGLLGSAFVTWYTFLPSFVLVLCGAPLAERLHGKNIFANILAAISAAVVGVILSLAVYLAKSVFAHAPKTVEGLGGMLMIGLLALLMLGRWRWPTPVALMVGGILGTGMTLLKMGL